MANHMEVDNVNVVVDIPDANSASIIIRKQDGSVVCTIISCMGKTGINLTGRWDRIL